MTQGKGTRVLVGIGPDASEVRVGSGLLAEAGAALSARAVPGPVLVVTDENVARHWLPRLLDSLSGAGFAPGAEVLTPGEGSKTLATVARIYDRLLELGADRRTPLVALGGGVVTDVAGFAAATYLRGLPWMAVPTSLLAQVDAAVGGKTGVNLPAGKNLVGSFHHPVAVLADVETLATLPERHRTNGLAEVVKTGLALSLALYGEVERRAGDLRAGDPKALLPVVSACVAEKAAIVNRDEREAGPRRILNLGHTAGHAIEAATGFEKVLHGEAVAVGLVIAARIAVSRGMFSDEEVERLGRILRNLGLPAEPSGLAETPDRDDVARHLGVDKKRLGSRLALVLPKTPGRAVIVEDGTPAEILGNFPIRV